MSLFGLLPKSRPARRDERLHDVAGRLLPLAIHRNPRAKRLVLRIVPGGRSLRLTAPPGVPERQIDAFLSRNQTWLIERLDEQSAPAPAIGGTIDFRGGTIRIRHSGAMRGVSRLTESDGERVLLLSGATEGDGVRRRVARFMRQSAEEMITPIARRHAATLDRPILAIRFRDTRSRWGSCTAGGTLSFSWRIMMAPDDIIDYLVAHEVAHLAEMNHGPRFWAHCRALCPDMDRSKRWLKENGRRLQAVDFGEA